MVFCSRLARLRRAAEIGFLPLILHCLRTWRVEIAVERGATFRLLPVFALKVWTFGKLPQRGLKILDLTAAQRKQMAERLIRRNPDFMVGPREQPIHR